MLVGGDFILNSGDFNDDGGDYWWLPEMMVAGNGGRWWPVMVDGWRCKAGILNFFKNECVVGDECKL